MTIRVRLPANMRALAEDQPSVEQAGKTVGQVLDGLTSRYPDLRPRILHADGNVQSFVNVFVDNQSIRDLDGLNTSVGPDAEILIVAALAGG